MPSRVLRSVSGAALISGLVACSTVSPVKTSLLSTSDAEFRGVHYFLPRAIVEVSLKTDPKNDKVALTYIPDTSHRYAANLNLTASTTDVFTLAVNDHGLLDSVATDTKDASATITDTALSAISEIIQTNNRFKFQNIERSGKTAQGRQNEFLFDPFNLPKGQGDIVVRPLDPDLATAVAGNRKIVREICPKTASICVPVLTPVEITLKGKLRTVRFVDVFPDPRYAVPISVDRNACTQTKTTLDLTNGILKSYKIDKPSEIAECLSIPLKVIKAILAAPADAIAGRTAGAQSQSGLLTAQTELLNAQAALLKAQNAAASEP